MSISPSETTHAKVMRAALSALDSLQALADALQAERRDVVAWIEGKKRPPEEKFERAVAIVLAHFDLKPKKAV